MAHRNPGDEHLGAEPLMVRPTNPRAARGGHRSTATKLIGDVQIEMAKEGGE